jgi:hypothetical protein
MTNTKISDYDIKDKPWCTLGPSCGPRTGVLLHPLTSIHPSTLEQIAFAEILKIFWRIFPCENFDRTELSRFA